MAEEYSYEYYIADSESSKRQENVDDHKSESVEEEDEPESSNESQKSQHDSESQYYSSQKSQSHHSSSDDDESDKPKPITFGSAPKSKEAEDAHRRSQPQTRQRSATFFTKKRLSAPVDTTAPILYPNDEISNLTKECQQIVKASAGDPEKEFHLGKYIMKGSHEFPKRTSIGLLYIKHASDQNFKEASMYYAKVLSRGKYCEKNVKKAKKVLKKYRKGTDNLDARFLYGKILRNDQQFVEALKTFKKAAKDGCYKSMVEWGKMCYLGQGTGGKRKMKAKKLFKQAKNHGFEEGEEWLANQNTSFAKKRAKEAARNGTTLGSRRQTSQKAQQSDDYYSNSDEHNF